MRNLALSLGLAAALASTARADPAITTSASLMREAPSAKAHVVQSVPARAEIDLANCAQNWCFASWRNLFGYLPVSVVARPPGAPYYEPSPPPDVAGGGVGPFFGYGWYQRW